MATQKKILIVDDEPDIIEFLSYNLKKEGFLVFSASNGKAAIVLAKAQQPDLIILDIMMPELDGIATCRALRAEKAFSNTPIAFLTAKDEDFTQIHALDSGGDDFISKPIKPRVLVSRIQALLRRSSLPSSDSEDEIQLDNLKINRTKFTVHIWEEEMELPKKEFELLWLLASKPGRVFTREEIFSSVWGADVIVGERTIDVHIRKLREKIGDEKIKTVKGIGYKFDF